MCAEGQISLTVVLTNIKYGGVNKETRPKSLALKLNHQDPGARQFFKEYYDQEVWFYTSENFLQSIPMTIPNFQSYQCDVCYSGMSPLLILHDMMVIPYH